MQGRPAAISALPAGFFYARVGRLRQGVRRLGIWVFGLLPGPEPRLMGLGDTAGRMGLGVAYILGRAGIEFRIFCD